MLPVICLLLHLFVPAQADRDQAVERARQALGESLGEEPDAIQLVRAVPARWNDGALGCPEPGRVYSQVRVDGYRALLRVGRELYAVHVAGSRAIVCDESPRDKFVSRVLQQETAPVAAASDEVPDHILTAVIDDLVETTGADRATVEVLVAESAVWPDGSLGCPEPGQEYTRAAVRGYRIVLGVAGEKLDYRVGESGWFMRCDPGLAGRPPDGTPPAR